MGKHDKALQRLCAEPPAADIKWTELKGILEQLGYTMLTNRGSPRKFFHRGKNALIICHRLHPSPDADKGCVADVVEHRRTHGFI